MHIPEASGSFSVQASSLIYAPLAHTWSVLIDLDHYSEWNTFVPSMHSTFQIGSLVTMQVQMRKYLRVTSVEILTAFEPQRLLAWKTQSPSWLLSGERFQLLTSIDVNTTRYWTRESFTGILAPVLKLLSEKDLQCGFDSVAQNLKARAEALLREM